MATSKGIGHTLKFAAGCGVHGTLLGVHRSLRSLAGEGRAGKDELRKYDS